MTFAAHYGVGSGIYMLATKTVCWVLGADPQTEKFFLGTMGQLGGIIGAAPDTIDWIACEYFGTPRWSIYTKFHHPDGKLLKIMQYTVAGWVHIEMDKPIHPPRLPRLTDPDCPEAFKRVLWKTWGWTFTVRDAIWTVGEIIAWQATMFLWTLSLMKW